MKPSKDTTRLLAETPGPSIFLRYFLLIILLAAVASLFYSFFISSKSTEYSNEEPPVTTSYVTRGIRELLKSVDDDFIKQEKLQEDLFLWSAYYHEQSALLGDNSLSLVLSGNANSTVERLTFIASNETHRIAIDAPLKSISPNDTTCHWTNYYSITKTIEGMKSLVVLTEEGEVQVPVYRPVTTKHDVVTCVSPMVANDKWQETIFIMVLYKYYESWAHYYVRSLSTPIHQLMQRYKDEINLEFFTIQPWARMSFSEGSSSAINPNQWLQFNGIDAAYTDCLLQYKDSAKFINFVDMDEFILPRIGLNYPREFASLFSHHANVAVYRYHNWDVAYNLSTDTDKFAVNKMLGTFKYAKTLNTNTKDTKFVTKPEYVNAISRFAPTELREGMRQVQLDHSARYVMTRLKNASEFTNKTIENQDPFWGPNYNLSDWRSSIIEPYNLWNLEIEMRRYRFGPNAGELWHVMSQSTFYRNLLEKCRTEKYDEPKEKLNKDVCFTTDHCEFPESIGISCTNVRSEYCTAASSVNGINLHFATRNWFSVEDGCIP